MSKSKLNSLIKKRYLDSQSDLVPYVGGKSELIGNIVPIILAAKEQYSLNEFHDLCGGGARLLLHLPFSLRDKRVYNDIDTGMCALFHCCSQPDLLPQLIDLLVQAGTGADIFNEAKRQRKQGKLGEDGYDLVTAAACAYIVARQSQIARRTHFDKIWEEPKNTKRYMNHIYRLRRFHSILEGITVTNRSVFDILIEKYDWSQSFIYLDPPYYPDAMASNDHYEENWTIDDHAELVKLLLYLPLGKVALSGLDNPCYKRLVEAGWRKIPLKNMRKKSSIPRAKNKQQLRQKEEVWINFDVPRHLEKWVNEYDSDPE